MVLGAGITATAAAPAIAGGIALLYSGASPGSAVVVPDRNDISLSASLQVTVDVVRDAANAGKTVVAKPRHASGTGWAVTLDATGRPCLGMIVSPGPNVVFPVGYCHSAAIPVGEWVTITASFDGSVIRVGWTGQATQMQNIGAAGIMTDAAEGTSMPLFVGREFPPGFEDNRAYPGVIDNLEVGPFGGPPTLRMRFNEGTGMQTFDEVGVAFGALTADNTPIWVDLRTCGDFFQTQVLTPGADTRTFGSGMDRYDGLGGDDKLVGGSRDDCLAGGHGNDELQGGSDDDMLFGDAGDDKLAGGSGNDWLGGGRGVDSLSGGGGDDRLDARDGEADTLDCGSGNDTVRIDAGLDIVAGDCESVVETPFA